MAVNCCVVPKAMLGFIGFTDIDTSKAGVTLSVVDPEMLPDAAVIVVEPAAADVANPLEPNALLMAATSALDEFQVTVVVKSCVVLSENVPVATNCRFVPLTMLGLVGVTAIDTSVAGVTVTIVDPDTFPHFPVTFTLPTPVDLAYIWVPSVLDLSVVENENPEKEATAVSTGDEVQVTIDVRSLVVLSA